MKIVDNFRIFNKILRKYRKRHCIKRIDRFSNGKKCTSYWEKEDWLGYIIRPTDTLTPQLREYVRFMVGDEVMNDKKVQEYLSCGFNPQLYFIKDEDKTPHDYIGIMLTNRDAYAILREYEKKVDSNGGVYYVVTNEEAEYPIYWLPNSNNNINPSC